MRTLARDEYVGSSAQVPTDWEAVARVLANTSPCFGDGPSASLACWHQPEWDEEGTEGCECQSHNECLAYRLAWAKEQVAPEPAVVQDAQRNLQQPPSSLEDK